jgi:hypothetical protein
MNVRKNFRSLTAEEKDRLVKALLKLKQPVNTTTLCMLIIT